jgi:hypothetical protein
VFSPVSHTYWLQKRIPEVKLEVQNGAAHFGSVEILPKVLAWVATTVNAELSTESASV